MAQVSFPLTIKDIENLQRRLDNKIIADQREVRFFKDAIGIVSTLLSLVRGSVKVQNSFSSQKSFEEQKRTLDDMIRLLQERIEKEEQEIQEMDRLFDILVGWWGQLRKVE